jgi:hypothetical protein
MPYPGEINEKSTDAAYLGAERELVIDQVTSELLSENVRLKR